MRCLCAAALLSCCVLGAYPALADELSPEQTEAQALFEQGLQFSAQARWADARTAFLESARRTPRASTYFNLAVSSLELGLGRAALDALARFDALSDPVAHADYRNRVAALREQAQARVGTLELSITPETAQLEVDGEIEPATGASRVLLLDPGAHVLRASADGHVSRTLEVTISARGAVHERLELSALPTPTPAPVDLTVNRAVAAPSTPSALPRMTDTAEPESRSLWSRPLTWIVIGAVVAAGATAAIVIATQDDSPEPYGGSTGRTF